MAADADGAPDAYFEVGEPEFDRADIAFARYTSAAFYDAEIEHMWSRTWQWACREEQMPQPGDYVVYEVGPHSALLVRQRDTTIRAFVNSCPHRGMQLAAAGENGRAKQFIRCPFHGLRWGLDGAVGEIPCRWDFPHVTDTDFDLLALPCATWGGFVFVNFDPDAMPLDAYLGVLPAHFERTPLERRAVSLHIEKVLPGNWKMCLEAFLEAFHVLATHPEGARYTADASANYDVFGPHVSRFMHSLGVASPQLAKPTGAADIVAHMGFDPGGLAEGQSARAFVAEQMKTRFGAAFGIDLGNRSTAEVIDSVQYYLFPNAFFFPGILLRLVYRFRPLAVDRCLFEILVLDPLPDGVVPGRPPAPVALAENEPFASVAGFDFAQVFDQDVANFHRQWAGIRASRKGAQTLANYQESRIRHLHDTLDAYLAPSPDARSQPTD